MKRKSFCIILIVIGVILLGVYSLNGSLLTNIFDIDGQTASNAYDTDGNIVFPDDLPIPSGDLVASSTVPLPDTTETGRGFTCTGLAYDKINDVFLVGDIGKLLPSSGMINSQILKLSPDFTTIVGTIAIGITYPSMGDVQGVTIDTSDNTIWFCAPSANKIYHISAAGANIGSFSINRPTGIAYSATTNSLWVLTYDQNIMRVSKTGTVAETYNFSYSDALDQCFLDEGHGYLYITAGVNYSGRNNIYLFNTSTHAQSIACTVDSYSVEGIWIGSDRMVIVNDGYYHSATDARNVANIYELT